MWYFIEGFVFAFVFSLVCIIVMSWFVLPERGESIEGDRLLDWIEENKNS